MNNKINQLSKESSFVNEVYSIMKNNQYNMLKNNKKKLANAVPLVLTYSYKRRYWESTPADSYTLFAKKTYCLMLLFLPPII